MQIGGLTNESLWSASCIITNYESYMSNCHPSYLLVQYFMLIVLFVLDPSYFVAFGRNENAGWFSKRASKISVVSRKYDVSSSILAFVDDMHIV